ncbi:MAG: 50S ribosomal protein L25 [Ferrimicrobium sp.]|uniref:50S ribosomal protein L25 n=1 Tax=Ferrimicrobium sp. TaxID=2926050 RepID=UPI00262ACC1D|nr:50S ribosomal protein L25 [Ferrimicrobium sp.]
MAKVIAYEGREPGSAESRRLRAAGKVPAVVYGGTTKTRNLFVDAHDFETALGHRVNVGALMELEVAGKVTTVQLQELQRHPVRRSLSHLDFLAINVREEMEATIELRSVSEELEMEEPSLRVRGHVKDIPDFLEISLEMLDEAETFTAGQIPLPKGVVLVGDPEAIVARLADKL